MNAQHANNPMSEYLLKIQLIITNSEFKNRVKAAKYETIQTRTEGDIYVRAMTKTDIFETYTYDEMRIYNTLSNYGYEDAKIRAYMYQPQFIPQSIKEELMIDARERFIATFIEKNKYYVNLTGNPFMGNDDEIPEQVALITDEFYEMYKSESTIYRNQPVHELPSRLQELLINSLEYEKIKKRYPDAEYLNYIGSYAIPIEVSRPAHDGDLLRVNTTKLTTTHSIFGNVTVEPDILHTFVSSYKKCRDYIFGTLRGEFNSIYENYDDFIRFLTIYMSIGATLNELSKESTSFRHMNSVTANNFFMLYGLPSVIMDSEGMIEFMKKFRLLLMDKGTNVVYRVKDLIGYEYTDIYTLVMVKQQVFVDGKPVFEYDDEGHPHPKQKIVFRRLGTSDDNTSYFKYRDENVEYSVEEITSGDPRWWNTPEVEEMLQSMNYTLSNSKYIQLDTHMSSSDIWWQCVIFLRGLLDNRSETKNEILNINTTINSTSSISLYNAVLVLIIIMNWHLVDRHGKHFNGEVYLPNKGDECVDLLFNGLYNNGSPKPLTYGSKFWLASFNFRIREEKPLWFDTLLNTKYIDPEEFVPMLTKILDRETELIGDVLMHDVRDIYDYLANKLRLASTIYEYREVNDIYHNLFLVDPVRNWYDKETFEPDTILMDEYKLTERELQSMKSFWYNNDDKIKVTYHSHVYAISVYEIMNKNANQIKVDGKFVFTDDEFMNAFSDVVLNTWYSNALMTSSISEKIKSNYKSIINDKVIMDVGNTDDGPKTFESMLFRSDLSLYKYLQSIKNNGDDLISLMRNIVKSMESYANEKLTALEYKVLGANEYLNILKEVISYFKSYMVEFSRAEMSVIFDNIFDNGGNSNMLSLYDEITNMSFTLRPRETIVLHDVSYMTQRSPSRDSFNMYDQAIFAHYTTFKNIKNTGYELWYDYKNKITKTAWNISDTTKVLVNIVANPTGGYRAIINCNNLNIPSPNHIGHY